MAAYIRIGKRAKVMEAYVIVCKECGEPLSTVLDGARIFNDWVTQELIRAKHIHKSDRPCKRHPKKGRKRAI